MNKTNNSPVTRAAVTEKYRKSYSVRTAANEAKVLRVRVGKGVGCLPIENLTVLFLVC